MKTYNKLVRDKVPERIEKNGETCEFHYADEQEYQQKLFEKLVEESQELLQSESIEEFADVLEVIDAIRALKQWKNVQLQPIRHKKLRSHGGFKNRIILEKA